MVYTIIVNNRSYELPKKTVAVMEDLDQAMTIDSNKGLSLRDKYVHLHEFVKRILGEDKAKECLGSDSLDEIDLSDLAITVRKIHDSYDKPVTDYEVGKMKERLGAIPMEKIAPMVAAAETVVKQQ
jgi:hypothetical protein